MANPYEELELLDQYLLLHFGPPEVQNPWPFGPKGATEFPVRCAEAALKGLSTPIPRALELGCAVGRACLELSVYCEEVIGVDDSARFIQAGREILEKREARFEVVEEAGTRQKHTGVWKSEFQPGCVQLIRGDATALPTELESFDLVLACNLLCRLPDPGSLLKRFPGLVRSGGRLFLTTPHTWLEQFTPRELWLSRDGRTGSQGIQDALAPHFRLVDRKDVPFMIREHRRKFQWSVAEATTWQRL